MNSLACYSHYPNYYYCYSYTFHIYCLYLTRLHYYYHNMFNRYIESLCSLGLFLLCGHIIIIIIVVTFFFSSAIVFSFTYYFLLVYTLYVPVSVLILGLVRETVVETGTLVGGEGGDQVDWLP